MHYIHAEIFLNKMMAFVNFNKCNLYWFLNNYKKATMLTVNDEVDSSYPNESSTELSKCSFNKMTFLIQHDSAYEFINTQEMGQKVLARIALITILHSLGNLCTSYCVQI